MEAYCFAAFAEALEVIPTTLAENAGLNPINIVTELRNRHAKGDVTAGINVRKVCFDCGPSGEFLFIYYFLFSIIGNYFQYFGRECCSAFVGFDKRNWAGGRDCEDDYEDW